MNNFPMDLSGDDDTVNVLGLMEFITTTTLASRPLTAAMLEDAWEAWLPDIYTREFEAEVVPR